MGTSKPGANTPVSFPQEVHEVLQARMWENLGNLLRKLFRSPSPTVKIPDFWLLVFSSPTNRTLFVAVVVALILRQGLTMQSRLALNSR